MCAGTHLAYVSIPPTLAAELPTTERTNDMSVAFDLMEEQALIVLEILITSAAIVVIDQLVLFHGRK